MLTEQRFDIILKLLEEKKSVTVTELRELLDASESTVRRDITALDKAGKLTKVFGGAVALNHKVTAYEPTVAQKSELNKDIFIIVHFAPFCKSAICSVLYFLYQSMFKKSFLQDVCHNLRDDFLNTLHREGGTPHEISAYSGFTHRC